MTVTVHRAFSSGNISLDGSVRDFELKKKKWREDRAKCTERSKFESFGSKSYRRLSELNSMLALTRSFSVTTALIFFLGASVAALGGGLIFVSESFLDHSNGLQRVASEKIQGMLLNVVSQSSTDFELATDKAVRGLIHTILDQTYRRAMELIDNRTRWCEFSVLEMTFLWNQGLYDTRDLDKTRSQLWEILMRFDSVTRVGVADLQQGNYVGIHRLQNGLYELEMRNETGSICRSCMPGALASHKYFWTLSRPFQEENWVFTSKVPNDPRSRPWFAAGIAGNGSSRWTSTYPLAQGSTLAITVAQAVLLSPSGAPLGVAHADLSIAFLQSLLNGIRRQLQNPEHSNDMCDSSGQALHLAVIDDRGRLLGTSDEAAASWPAGQLESLRWEKAAVGNPTIRKGLEVVSGHWKDNWSAACDDSSSRYRLYPHAELVVATSPARGETGLRLLVVAVGKMEYYRGEIDEALVATRRRVEERSNQSAQMIADINVQVKQTLERSKAVQVIISIAVVLVGSACVNLFVLHVLIRPLQRLAQNMERLASLDFHENGWASSERGLSAFREVSAIKTSFERMADNLRSFALYVPAAVVRLLLANGAVARLGVEPCEATVFFSDIAGFTGLAESLPPATLIALLDEYLEEMTAAVDASSGTVGKYIGDAVMAFWNSPDPVVHHPQRACACALDQQARLSRLRAQWAARGLPELRVRMGLSLGTVLHGNIGSKRRMEWGLIGDEVNLAARLETACKYYGADILISGKLNHAVREDFLTRPVDSVVVYGKREAVEVFELIAPCEDATPQQKALCDASAALVGHYRARRFAAALEAARSLLVDHPGDWLSRLYAERCEPLLSSPPGEAWDYTVELASK